MSKIIVIEEDGAMRVLISEWLRGERHDVRSRSPHGISFDAAASESGGAVDLVVLDLPQPRSTAGETARVVQAVRRAYPRSPIIGISTQAPRSLMSDSDVARALGVNRLLAKPCTREELLEAVAATLAE